jgi:hypothetical protein
MNIYYESNPIWGWVNTLYDLTRMLKGQLAEPNSIHTVDDFLDGSLSDAEGITYGTRVEHTGPKSLRDYLEEENLLTVFLNNYESYLRVV